MNESNIKLIINSTNDRGYSQVSLMVGKTLGDMKHKRVEFVNYFNQLLDSKAEWLKES